MSLILCDGFEDMTLWSQTTPNSIMSSPGGRTKSQAAVSNSDVNPARADYKINTADLHLTYICGFAYKISSMPYAAGPYGILTFANQSTRFIHLYMPTNQTNLAVAAGAVPMPPAAVAVSTQSLQQDRWYYIELKVVQHATAGTITVNVDGQTWVQATGLITRLNGTLNIDAVVLGTYTPAMGSYAYYDDFYLANGAGTTNNNFIGDLIVETIYPNGMSATGWFGADGDQVDNFRMVSETNQPSMVEYVESNTVGVQDLYTYQPLAHSGGIIKGITNSTYAQKSDTTARGLKLLIKDPSSTVNKSANYLLTQTATSYSYTLDKKNNGQPYTISDINALIAGIEVGS